MSLSGITYWLAEVVQQRQKVKAFASCHVAQFCFRVWCYIRMWSRKTNPSSNIRLAEVEFLKCRNRGMKSRHPLKQEISLISVPRRESSVNTRTPSNRSTSPFVRVTHTSTFSHMMFPISFDVEHCRNWMFRGAIIFQVKRKKERQIL
eukprot:PhF_6_TR37616/c1_g3_i3/m.55904